MRGKKGAVWAVVILAAFITAGLVLSCGDDDGGNGEPDVTCEDFCEKFVDECEFFEGDVDDCVDECDAFYDDFKDIEGVTEVFECAVDTRCGYVFHDCFCKAFCGRYFDCEEIDEIELIYCMALCNMGVVEVGPEGIIGGTLSILATPCDELDPLPEPE